MWTNKTDPNVFILSKIHCIYYILAKLHRKVLLISIKYKRKFYNLFMIIILILQPFSLKNHGMPLYKKNFLIQNDVLLCLYLCESV